MNCISKSLIFTYTHTDGHASLWPAHREQFWVSVLCRSRGTLTCSCAKPGNWTTNYAMTSSSPARTHSHLHVQYVLFFSCTLKFVPFLLSQMANLKEPMLHNYSRLLDWCHSLWLPWKCIRDESIERGRISLQENQFSLSAYDSQVGLVVWLQMGIHNKLHSPEEQIA